MADAHQRRAPGDLVRRQRLHRGDRQRHHGAAHAQAHDRQPDQQRGQVVRLPGHAEGEGAQAGGHQRDADQHDLARSLPVHERSGQPHGQHRPEPLGDHVHAGLHRRVVQYLLEVARQQQPGAEKGGGEHQHRHVGLGDHPVLEQPQIDERVIAGAARARRTRRSASARWPPVSTRDGRPPSRSAGWTTPRTGTWPARARAAGRQSRRRSPTGPGDPAGRRAPRGSR